MSKESFESLQKGDANYRRKLIDKGIRTTAARGQLEGDADGGDQGLEVPTRRDQVAIAQMIQESLDIKGANDAKYQKIRMSDKEFEMREGQERAKAILAYGGSKKKSRAIGVKSTQDVESRLDKLGKEGFKFSNRGNNARQLTTGDTRFFNNAIDWETGAQIGVGVMGADDGLGDTNYQ